MRASIFRSQWLVLLAAVLFLSAAPLGGDYFVSDEGGFKVKIPGEVEISAGPTEGGVMNHKFQSQYMGVLYMVSYAEIGGEYEEDKLNEMEASALQSFVNSMAGKVLDAGTWKTNKTKGRRARITVDNSLYMEYGVAFYNGNMYQIVFGQEGELDEKAVKSYMKSFKLL